MAGDAESVPCCILLECRLKSNSSWLDKGFILKLVARGMPIEGMLLRFSIGLVFMFMFIFIFILMGMLISMFMFMFISLLSPLNHIFANQNSNITSKAISYSTVITFIHNQDT